MSRGSRHGIPMTFALFGIENDGLNLAVNLLVFFLVVIWVALVYWTYADARRRLDDPLLIGCATAASLFPFIGTIVYAIVRPPEYLEDVHERELEMRAAEARLALLENRTCPQLRLARSSRLPALPELHAEAQGAAAGAAAARSTRAGRVCPYCEAEVERPAARRAAGGAPAARHAGRRRRSEPRGRAHRRASAAPQSGRPSAPTRPDRRRRPTALCRTAL